MASLGIKSLFMKPFSPLLEILGKFSFFFFLGNFLFSCLNIERILSSFLSITVSSEDLSQCYFGLPPYFQCRNPASLKAGSEAQVKAAPGEEV